MTETLQDRLRQAADDNSDHPPIFGLYFEAADRIDALEQAAKARADSDAEEDRMVEAREAHLAGNLAGYPARFTHH